MKQKMNNSRQFRLLSKCTLLFILSIIFMGTIYAQERTVSGTINDKSGTPMPGVNVVIKGTTVGTVTDLDGKFTLKVPDNNAVLVISFVGYIKQEITVGPQTSINLELEEEVTALNEVVVVGYGSMQRSNVAGSISSLKSDDIKKSPSPNVIDAIRGQIPGVRITESNGAPGSDVDVFIRGKRSLGTTSDENAVGYINPNAPLVVVDGIPYVGGKISDINPNDIASMNVLKDAAATSVYGSSAANGVILITTKNGTEAKPELTLSMSTGFQNFAMKPTVFNAQQYCDLKSYAARKSWNDTSTLTPKQVLDPYEYANYLEGKSTNWLDALTRTGRTNQVGISLSGGTDKFHYYSNLDMYNETPIILRTVYDRYSFRVNSDYTPYKWVTLGANSQFTLTDANETGTFYNFQNQADFGEYIGDSPLGRTRDSSGYLVPTVNSDQFQYNPLYQQAHSVVLRRNSTASIGPYIELKFLDGLTYRLNAFAQFHNERYTRYLDGMYDAQNIGSNYYNYNVGQSSSYLCDNILNYSKTFFNKHQVNITALYGFQSYRQENFQFTVQDSMTNYLGIYDIVNADPFGKPTPTTYTRQIIPTFSGKAYYVGRLVYGYDNRYIVTIVRRWDYTSQFGPNNREGIFPSYAFAWNVNNEEFLKSLPMIDLLKLRISWGEVGNDRIPQYSYAYTAAPGTYAFGGSSVSGWTSDRSGNFGLHWETSKQLNTGLDFGLFKDRISGTFEYYNSVNSDLLYSMQVPIIFGDSHGYIVSNIGETKSWGYSALLTCKILDGNFKWQMTFNWATDRNKIVKLGGSVDKKGQPVNDLANGWFIGQDIDVNYDYKFLGVYQIKDTVLAKKMHPDKKYYGPGDPIVADIDHNDTVNAKDKTYQSSRVTPTWYGSITNTFSFKGFELSVLIETVQGIKKVNSLLPNPLSGIRSNSVAVNYWTLDNPSNDYPRPRSGTFDYGTAIQLQDASFICIRNVSLSYDVPKSLLKGMPIKGITAYIRGNNLKYFTKWIGFSPDQLAPTTTSSAISFPVTRNWIVGLNITF